MSEAAIREDVRGRVHEHFRGRCAYCHSPLFLFPAAKQLDHIVPRSAGGGDDESNLCLCCPACNGHKAKRTAACDPLTLATTLLFRPRTDHWNEHFTWTHRGARIIGLTACGRATVELLRMNDSELVQARLIWIAASWHPPVDDGVITEE